MKGKETKIKRLTIKQRPDKRGLRSRKAHGLAVRDDAEDEDDVAD